jgi:hypothetical protein
MTDYCFAASSRSSSHHYPRDKKISARHCGISKDRTRRGWWHLALCYHFVGGSVKVSLHQSTTVDGIDKFADT